MKIYVASSWRNALQPSIVEALRLYGHQVYDFRNPVIGNTGFSWEEIDPNWQNWNASEYRAALQHPIAKHGYGYDIAALKACDACVLVLPSGRSASWEFGYAMGQGKRGAVVQFEKMQPELMYQEAAIITSMEELFDAFRNPVAEEETGKSRNCKACSFCLLDNMDFICAHKDAGAFGKLTRVATAPDGHCGPKRLKFEQHPLREANGNIKPANMRK